MAFASLKSPQTIVDCTTLSVPIRPSLVHSDWIKPGAVVIDVGVSPVDDPSKKRGYKLVGDVDYEEANKVSSSL